MNKSIITIGGGSGHYALLRGLRDLQGIDIKAVVSMVDSGGSTGRLRDELGILPPGDILKCILALSTHQEVVRTILQKRFENDRRLKGHNAGNMLLTMLSRYTGSFPSGVAALAEILDVRGEVLPVTIDRATLVANLTDGTRIYGERAIDIPRGDQRGKICDVFLVPHHSDSIKVYPPVLEAIKTADFIILGPGDLFTSIIPNLIVPGIREALSASPAKMIYVLNLMTKFGETHGFKAFDFLAELEKYTGRKIDGVIYNTHKPVEAVLKKYAEQQSKFVELDEKMSCWDNRALYAADLLENPENIVRHEPGKLAALLDKIISSPI